MCRVGVQASDRVEPGDIQMRLTAWPGTGCGAGSGFHDFANNISRGWPGSQSTRGARGEERWDRVAVAWAGDRSPRNGGPAVQHKARDGCPAIIRIEGVNGSSLMCREEEISHRLQRTDPIAWNLGIGQYDLASFGQAFASWCQVYMARGSRSRLLSPHNVIILLTASQDDHGLGSEVLKSDYEVWVAHSHVVHVHTTARE